MIFGRKSSSRPPLYFLLCMLGASVANTFEKTQTTWTQIPKIRNGASIILTLNNLSSFHPKAPISNTYQQYSSTWAAEPLSRWAAELLSHWTAELLNSWAAEPLWAPLSPSEPLRPCTNWKNTRLKKSKIETLKPRVVAYRRPKAAEATTRGFKVSIFA